jgi:hypothetical protein
MKIDYRRRTANNRPTPIPSGERIPKPNTEGEYGGDRMLLLSIKTLPPIEVGRREGESARSAARRFLDIQQGCYGD